MLWRPSQRGGGKINVDRELEAGLDNEGCAIDWFNPKLAEDRWFLEHATQLKNIWVPYGE